MRVEGYNFDGSNNYKSNPNFGMRKVRPGKFLHSHLNELHKEILTAANKHTPLARFGEKFDHILYVYPDREHGEKIFVLSFKTYKPNKFRLLMENLGLMKPQKNRTNEPLPSSFKLSIRKPNYVYSLTYDGLVSEANRMAEYDRVFKKVTGF